MKKNQIIIHMTKIMIMYNWVNVMEDVMARGFVAILVEDGHVMTIGMINTEWIYVIMRMNMLTPFILIVIHV